MGFTEMWFHATALGVFASAYKWLFIDNSTVIRESHGSYFQHLTIIGLTVAAVAQLIGLFANLTGLRFLRTAKERVNLVAAPLEVLVSILYYSIKAIDENLLIDKRLNIRAPDTVDMSMHLYPAVFELADVLILSPMWTTSIPRALVIFGLFSAGYWQWVHYLYTKNGFYAYPLLELASTPQRLAIFGGATVLVTLTFEVIKYLQQIVENHRVILRERTAAEAALEEDDDTAAPAK
jgi:hypothetical protein